MNLLTLAGTFFGGFAAVCVVAALLWFVIAKRNRVLIGYAPVRLSAYRDEHSSNFEPGDSRITRLDETLKANFHLFKRLDDARRKADFGEAVVKVEVSRWVHSYSWARECLYGQKVHVVELIAPFCVECSSTASSFIHDSEETLEFFCKAHSWKGRVFRRVSNAVNRASKDDVQLVALPIEALPDEIPWLDKVKFTIPQKRQKLQEVRR